MYSDKELVAGCIHGDPAITKYFFIKYKDSMYGLCLRYCGSAEDAKDLLQDGFIKVFSVLNGFRFQCPLDRWVRKVFTSVAINSLRKRYLIKFHEEKKYFYDDATFGDDFWSLQYEKDLLSIIQKLPTGFRIIFNLKVIDDYEHNEIAEMLGISLNTSKTQLKRAKALLRKMLKDW